MLVNVQYNLRIHKPILVVWLSHTSREDVHGYVNMLFHSMCLIPYRDLITAILINYVATSIMHNEIGKLDK